MQTRSARVAIAPRWTSTQRWLLTLILAMSCALRFTPAFAQGSKPRADAERCSREALYAPALISRRDAATPGTIALTFDDGPHPRDTPIVLDALSARTVPGSFFVVGVNITPKTYHLIQRMVREGHTIGSHSYTHDIHMATRYDDGGDYIEGQYALVQFKIELALLATSAEHFDALSKEVFQRSYWDWPSAKQVKREWHDIEARHIALLERLGRAGSRRPFHMLLTRPPGGYPYVSSKAPNHDAIQRHQHALARRGWVSVIWHGGAGDTVPGKKDDLNYLAGNLMHSAKQGGVVVIHDRIRPPALLAFLRELGSRQRFTPIALDTLLETKYGCDTQSLRVALAPQNLGGQPIATMRNAPPL